jgi:hypothetical protein
MRGAAAATNHHGHGVHCIRSKIYKLLLYVNFSNKLHCAEINWEGDKSKLHLIRSSSLFLATITTTVYPA